MNKLQVVYKPVADLIPYANNSRTHSDEQVTQVAASIKEFGFTNPVLIDEKDGIIAGHGRLMAAKKLDLEQVPTITLEGLTEAQRKAYVIADNKLALNSGWDEELLIVELEHLQDIDFDIGLTGFDDAELEDLLGFDDDCLDEMPGMAEGDRDADSLGTITIRLPVNECDEVKSWLKTVKPNDPSGALLEVCRNAQR